jgi:hypothetical protein
MDTPNSSETLRHTAIEATPMPFEMSTTAFTEAVGFVREDKFVGTMRLTYDFSFSQISPQVRMMLSRQFGHIPDRAHMMGAGRFEILIQADI